MTSSITRSASFTITDARYVSAKLAADLRQLNNLYGRPPLSDLDDYAEEAALLLRDGHLGTVDYGFKDVSTNEWKLRLRYTATVGGQLVDSRIGSLPTTANVAPYAFYSYLTYSAKFNGLTTTQQSSIKTTLPIVRVGADEPSARSGTSQGGHSYARNGAGVDRNVYTAY
jgi:hypothetical protein